MQDFWKTKEKNNTVSVVQNSEADFCCPRAHASGGAPPGGGCSIAENICNINSFNGLTLNFLTKSYNTRAVISEVEGGENASEELKYDHLKTVVGTTPIGAETRFEQVAVQADSAEVASGILFAAFHYEARSLFKTENRKFYRPV